jgi:hypothetical protein
MPLENLLHSHDFRSGWFSPSCSAAYFSKVDFVLINLNSISNLGMFGIDAFEAVINLPQTAILAVGGGRAVALPGLVCAAFLSSPMFPYAPFPIHDCNHSIAGSRCRPSRPRWRLLR